MTTDARRRTPRHPRRIRDARGRRVEAVDPLTLHVLRRHDVIDAPALDAIVAADGLRIRRSERAFLIVGLIAMALVLGLFLYELIVQGLSSARYAKSAALLYFAIVPWFIWFLIRRGRLGKIAPILLEHHRCPHCGYDLQGLPDDDRDGTTVCPECACAWRLREPVQSLP